MKGEVLLYDGGCTCHFVRYRMTSKPSSCTATIADGANEKLEAHSY
jgi:hypothetical protein